MLPAQRERINYHLASVDVAWKVLDGAHKRIHELWISVDVSLPAALPASERPGLIRDHLVAHFQTPHDTRCQVQPTGVGESKLCMFAR